MGIIINDFGSVCHELSADSLMLFAFSHLWAEHTDLIALFCEQPYDYFL